MPTAPVFCILMLAVFCAASPVTWAPGVMGKSKHNDCLIIWLRNQHEGNILEKYASCAISRCEPVMGYARARAAAYTTTSRNFAPDSACVSWQPATSERISCLTGSINRVRITAGLFELLQRSTIGHRDTRDFLIYPGSVGKNSLANCIANSTMAASEACICSIA